MQAQAATRPLQDPPARHPLRTRQPLGLHHPRHRRPLRRHGHPHTDRRRPRGHRLALRLTHERTPIPVNTTPAGNEPHRPGGTLAPTAPGNPHMQPLTRTQKILTGIVVAAVLIIATLGFIGSYAAVTELAKAKHFGRFAHAFPVAVDAGIIAFLALDLLLTWRRIAFPLLRYTAWGLTAATIAFNAATAWPDRLGVGMHGTIPILFVIAVEAARHAIGRIADITADKHIEGPPVSRWILNPVGTFVLWRRQRLWGIRSWDKVVDLERERRIYRAQLRRQHGRSWRRKADADQLLVLRLTADGMSVQ